jgi:hypothetical protein
LGSGLALEHVLGQPRSLPEFNTELIRLFGQPGEAVREPGASQPARAGSEDGEAAPVACLRIRGLDQTRYGELLGHLELAGIGQQQRMFLIDQSLGWWVYWPPEYESVQREKTLRAIRAAGVRDALPISKGAMAQAFSLGVFATEEQAQTHRNRLRSRGLEKAEFGPRPGVAEREIHLLCMLRDEAQRDKLLLGLPTGVEAVERGECPEVRGASEP